MAGEAYFLLHALRMGMVMTFLYDIFRVLRNVFPHRQSMVSLEDFCFWVYCAAEVFLFLYHESNGVFRWFAVLGASLGMFLYRKLFSPFFVKGASWLLKWALWPFIWLQNKIKIPFQKAKVAFRRWRSALKERRRRVREQKKWLLKKRLTLLLKMLKIKAR